MSPNCPHGSWWCPHRTGCGVGQGPWRLRGVQTAPPQLPPVLPARSSGLGTGPSPAQPSPVPLAHQIPKLGGHLRRPGCDTFPTAPSPAPCPPPAPHFGQCHSALPRSHHKPPRRSPLRRGQRGDPRASHLLVTPAAPTAPAGALGATGALGGAVGALLPPCFGDARCFQPPPARPRPHRPAPRSGFPRRLPPLPAPSRPSPGSGSNCNSSCRCGSGEEAGPGRKPRLGPGLPTPGWDRGHRAAWGAAGSWGAPSALSPRCLRARLPLGSLSCPCPPHAHFSPGLCRSLHPQRSWPCPRSPLSLPARVSVLPVRLSVPPAPPSPISPSPVAVPAPCSPI